ncbi:MAG: hypothetical protein K6D37_10010 [Prevotella sp.]|nr:hypothetical protein [Prevotella sp.]
MAAKCFLSINNYLQNGDLNLNQLEKDIYSHAMPISKIKYTDLIDSDNGVYFFIYDNKDTSSNNILYIGKSSSWALGDRLAFHLSINPKGWMNNVMKYLAWLHSSAYLSIEDFLDDKNAQQRNLCFRKALTFMKGLRYVCVSFGVASNKAIAHDIGNRENELIK